MKATIEEKGNGFPNIGALIYDAENDAVYRVLGGSGNIATNRGGRGNTIEQDVEYVGCASDISDEEFDEIENYGVTVE